MKISKEQLFRVARAAGLAVVDALPKVLADKKRCSSCNLWLHESEFYKKRSAYDGLQAYCKSCKKEKSSVTGWSPEFGKCE